MTGGAVRGQAGSTHPFMRHADLQRGRLADNGVICLDALRHNYRLARELTDAKALSLLAEEFPGRPIERVWVAVDGRGALAKSGAAALVLCEVGDGYVARHIPWTQAVASSFRDGVVRLDLSDVAAPLARLALQNWPPAPGPDEDRRAA